MNRINLIRKIVIGIVMLAVLPAYPFSDQTTSERILRENKHFIEFINRCVTNFPLKKNDILKDVYEKYYRKTIKIEKKENRYKSAKDSDLKKAFLMRIYQQHFNADVAYLQSDYKRTYKRVYQSQGGMDELYRFVLKNIYLEDSKSILDSFAPGIIRSKNSRARLYLTLGYRDRTVAWTHYSVGLASNPRLHSYKLYQYEDAIKMTRRAKRYGFLALFESQKANIKQKIYYQFLLTERERILKDNKDENKKATPVFFNRFLVILDKKLKKDEEEKEIIKESNITFEENEKRGLEKDVFQLMLDKRIQFRKETRVSKFLLNQEFDRAEDVLRKYVDDFNFKLVIATFDTLDKIGKSDSTNKNPIDYSKLKVHLKDNYLRFVNPSVVDELLSEVKVEDSVKQITADDDKSKSSSTDNSNAKDSEEKNK